MIELDYKKDPELFNKTAREWAKKIAKAQCKNNKGKVVEMKTKKTQVRNFYDKVLELLKEAEEKEWEDVYPFVKMLNSKVAYARTREVVNCKFVDMMQTCINQIDKEEKLKNFKLFFEAVIGFYKEEK